MFSKLALFATVSMAVFAAAMPTPGGTDGGISNSCNSGPVQCCNSTMDSKSAQATQLIGLLGIVTGPITGLVGVTCSPVGAIAVTGNSCSTQTVCCSDNSFKGVIALGCTPINLNA